MFAAGRLVLLVATAAALAVAGPVPAEPRATKCSAYTIIDTRGTTEIQGPSIGFRTMNTQIRAQVSGGAEYDTVYAAGLDQNSALATTNIVNKVTSTLASDASHCFILEGYSQGAAATVDALPKLTGAAADAVKGVFLIGNPRRKPGLACNVDQNGGSTTKNTRGLESFQQAIPDSWVSKTKDVCLSLDAVCDSPFGNWATHLTYGFNAQVQSLGAKFAVAALNGQSA
ncbi:unnamed protein product [Parajaminaea phylloscopi]